MSYKEELFTIRGWAVTIVHDFIIGGALLFATIVVVQLYGIDVAFQVPSIERVFKK